MSIRSAVKSVLLPKGVAARRIPFGVAAGVVMEIDFSFQARIFFGLYEREIANHLRALVRPGMRCFDIGSGVGYYSLALARRCGAEVVAVDASPSVAEQLRRNVAANDLPVTVVEGRVGGGGTGDPLTIDRLAETYFRPDFIKMDIEGAETSALRGATNVLAGHAPSLVIEVHGSDIEAECRALLEAQGYTPFAVAPPAGKGSGQCLLIWFPRPMGVMDGNGMGKQANRLLGTAFPFPLDRPVKSITVTLDRTGGRQARIEYVLFDPGVGNCR